MKKALIVADILLGPMLLVVLLLVLFPEKERMPRVRTWTPVAIPADLDVEGFEPLMKDGAFIERVRPDARDGFQIRPDGSVLLTPWANGTLTIPVAWQPFEIRFEASHADGGGGNRILSVAERFVDSWPPEEEEEDGKSGKYGGGSRGIGISEREFVRGRYGVHAFGKSSFNGKNFLCPAVYSQLSLNGSRANSRSVGGNMPTDGFCVMEFKAEKADIRIENLRIRRLPNTLELAEVKNSGNDSLTPEEKKAGWLQLDKCLFGASGAAPHHLGMVVPPISGDPQRAGQSKYVLFPSLPEYLLRFDYQGTARVPWNTCFTYRSSHPLNALMEGLVPFRESSTFRSVEIEEIDERGTMSLWKGTDATEPFEWQETFSATQGIGIELKKEPGSIITLRKLRVLPRNLTPLFADKLDGEGILRLREREPGVETVDAYPGFLLQCDMRTKGADDRLQWAGILQNDADERLVGGVRDAGRRDEWCKVTLLSQCVRVAGGAYEFEAVWQDGLLGYATAARESSATPAVPIRLTAEKGEIELRNIRFTVLD